MRRELYLHRKRHQELCQLSPSASKKGLFLCDLEVAGDAFSIPSCTFVREERRHRQITLLFRVCLFRKKPIKSYQNYSVDSCNDLTRRFYFLALELGVKAYYLGLGLTRNQDFITRI